MEPHLYIKGFDEDVGLIKNKLAETNLLLEILMKVNSLISKKRTFEDFCMGVIKILQEKLKFQHIYIWIRSRGEPSQLKLITDEALGGDKRRMSIDQGIVGRSIREAKTICLPNVSTDPDYVDLRPQAKSELCVPLMTKENVIGALNIETDEPQTFKEYIQIVEIIVENLSHMMKLDMLYRTEEQFHHLVDNINEGVAVFDSKERTLYTNIMIQNMTGFSATELSARTIREYFDGTTAKEIFQNAGKGKIKLNAYHEAMLISKNNEHLPALIHADAFRDGDTILTISDLRPKKAALKKLVQTERFLSSITQHCPEAIVGLDTNDVVQSWNAGAERIFGFKADEIIGKSITAIIPEEKIAAGEGQHILEEAKSKGIIRGFETTRLHKNGTPVAISLTASSIKDEHGQLVGFVALYRDITAQKKWERELQDRFEKMQDAYKEMGKQRRYLDYLTDMINMAADSHYSRNQIATFLVNAVVMLTKVTAATLRFYDSAAGKLVLAAQSGLHEDWWGKKSINYSGSLAEAATNDGHPLKILDILSHPRYTSPALAQKNNLRSALIIPLQAQGEIIGSLTLYLSHEADLSLLDDEFITVFAKQAALAFKLCRT